MEAARMPMLSLQLKNSPESVEFSTLLKGFISSFYHEDGANYAKECTELETLRQNAVQVTQDFVGCSTLKKYYSQLQYLQRRFPMGEGDELATQFTWEDLCTGKLVTYADIRFEQACIMYNIGALHSVLGAMDNRQSPEGMKVSCTHFQCAAWSLQTLRDTFGYPLSADMSHDFLTFQIELMLAQAQECILEKSMTDNRKSTITAKLAAQIVEYYRQAMKYLDSSHQAGMISGRQYKIWKKRMEIKSNYHGCVMYLYMGNQAEEQQKWGERLCWFQAALDKLTECIKLAKGEESEIEEALKFSMDVIGGKFSNAKKDNDFVYHDKVPALESLPEVKGASLVKGIPFNPTDPEVSGPDIFQRLVPMEAHEASSLYSEEKAKLLRRVGSETEEKNNELSQFLTSLQINPSQLEPTPERLPEVLLEKCAAISVNPSAVDDLVNSMQSLSNVATDVESNIKEIIDMWKEDEAKDQEFQALFGRKAGTVIGSEIVKDCAKYQEGLTKASQSNIELHKAMNTHISNLKLLLLSPEELKQTLPEVGRDRTPEEQEVVENMKKLMAKVEEMQKQRETLEAQLRDQVHNDDITTSLVVQEGDKEDFFRESLKKHDSLVQLIEQNLSAQANILRALTEANANYAPLRKQAQDIQAKREAMIQGLVLSYDVYEDLLSKSQKGVEFYRKLETNVARLHERTVRLCKQQEEERQNVTQKHKARIAASAPARPTAPKPSRDAGGSTPSPGDLPPEVAALAAYAGVDPAAAMKLSPSSPAAPTPKAPTLKDYLPYMKPKTFGVKGQPPAVPPAAAGGIAASAMDQYAMYGGAGLDLNQVPGVPSYVSSAGPASQPIHSGAGATPASQPSVGAYPGMPPQQHISGATGARQPTPGPAPSHPPSSSYGQQPYGQAPQNYPAAAGQTPYTGPVAPQQHSTTAPQASGPGMVSGLDKATDSAHTISTVHTPIATPTPQPQANVRSRKLESANVLPPGYAAVDGPDPAEEAKAKRKQTYQSTVQPATQQSNSVTPVSMQQPPATATHSQLHSYTQQHPYYRQQQQQQQYWQYYHGQTQAQPVGDKQTSIQPPAQQYHPPATSASSAAYNSNQVATAYSQSGHQYQQGSAGTQSGSAQTYQQQYYQQQQQAGGQQQPAAGYQATQYPVAQTFVQQQQQPYSHGTTQQQQQPGVQPQQAVHPSPQHAHGLPAQQQTAQSQPPTHQSSQQPAQQQMHQVVQPAQQQQGVPQQPTQPQQKQSVPGQPAQYSTPQYQASQYPQQGGGYSAQQAQYNVAAAGTQSPAGQRTGSPAHTAQGYTQASYQYQNQNQTSQTQGQYHQGTQQSGQHAATQGYGNQSYQQQHVSNTSNTGSYSTTQAQAYSGWQGATYGQYSAAQTNAAQSAVYSSGQTGVTSAVGYSNASKQSASGQQAVVSQVPGQQQQHYSPSHAGVTYAQGYSAQGASAQQAQYASSGSTGYGANPAAAGYSQSQQQGYAQAKPATSVAGSQATYGGQQYSQTGGYGHPQQGTPTHQQYPAAQTGYQQQTGVGQTQQQQQYYGQYGQNQTSAQPNTQYQYNQQQQPQQQNYGSQPVQGGSTTPVNPNLPSPLLPTAAPAAAQPQIPPQPPAPAPVPVASPGPAAAPVSVPAPERPRAGSLPPDSGAQNIPPQAPPGDVGSPATHPRNRERKLSSSTTSSLDDILSSSPDVGQIATAKKDCVLTPKVITAEEIQRQNEERMKNDLMQSTNKDPYTDQDTLGRFVAEVEKFEKMVESLNKPTLSGPTALEKEWKDLGDNIEKSSKQLSMGIARCYPVKNRSVDIMPYDYNRVVISGKDDYINASHIGDLMPSCPKVITTQCPIPATMTDYWQMVYEQGTEVIVMLAHENETGKQKIHAYWPTEKGKQLTYGPFKLNLQSFRLKQHWVERIIHLAHSEKTQARTVVHLQFLGWPPSGQPESPSHLLQFIAEVHSFYVQQRSLIKPVIVHCSDGIGRTGAFLVIYTGVQEVNQGNPLVDVLPLVRQLRAKRKHMITEKEQLRLCFNTILYHCQDVLMKRGILTNRAHFGDKLPSKGEKTHQRKPSEDFIMGTTSSLSVIQSSVDKMHVKQDVNAVEQNGFADNAHAQSGHAAAGGDATVASAAEAMAAAMLSSPEVFSAEPSEATETDDRSRSGSSASGVSRGSSQGSARPSPQHTGNLPNLPPSLADLQNPNTFKLDQKPTGPAKRKVTKQSFIEKTSSIQDSHENNPDDPLSSLDPLWTVKGGDKS